MLLHWLALEGIILYGFQCHILFRGSFGISRILSVLWSLRLSGACTIKVSWDLNVDLDGGCSGFEATNLFPCLFSKSSAWDWCQLLRICVLTVFSFPFLSCLSCALCSTSPSSEHGVFLTSLPLPSGGPQSCSVVPLLWRSKKREKMHPSLVTDLVLIFVDELFSFPLC